ncbi:MAG: SPOR domain-containing protein [Rhodopseudomonas sp.]|uniref:SPOR domain-containing protein n=1 Tax=Rhodopseudomonas sp. TaxID=1078 RepID=UPI0039E6F6EA
MARKTDDLADSFSTEETGGWLTHLLADEEDLGPQDKWRLGSWAAASLGAVVLAIMAVQNASDRRQEQTAATEVAKQSQIIQRLAKDTQTATSRLTAAIDTLNTDRDRLYARVGTLEQGLDSVTGSIAREPTGNGKPPAAAADTPMDRWGAAASLPEIPAKPAAPAVSTAPAMPAVEAKPNGTVAPARKWGAIEPPPAAAPPQPPASIVAAEPAPASPAIAPAAAPPIAPPVQLEAKKPSEEKRLAEVSQEKSRPDKHRLDPAPPQPPVAQTATAAISTTPLIPSRSILAPPDPGAAKLLETKAPSPPEIPAAPEAVPETPASRTEFGVDLGSANTVEGLRGLWRKLSKTHKALEGLQPIIMIKENGNSSQLRLVAGPIGDAAAAAKVCATLGSADRACEASVYDGQRLPMVAPASAPQPPPKPPTRRHRERVTLQSEPPPAPAPPQETPPPPQPSALSSILGIR